jgi:hypothetical protein
MKYGIKMHGLLLEKFDTPEEAYEAGQFGYEETGEFHEVVAVYAGAQAINE